MKRVKRHILCLTLSCLSWVVYGQKNMVDQQDTSQKIIIVETMPEFPGGVQRLHKIIEDSLKYPDTARKDRIGGKVITQFVVDTLGNVIDIKVIQGIRADIDKEAIRLVGLLNGWTPGTQAGKKVKVQYSLPLSFYPDNRWKKKYKKNERNNK